MKKQLFFSLLLPLFLCSKTLKIASYNVENLFDMHYNGSEYDEYLPRKHNWTPSILKKKLTNISEVICDIDADIIGLQEIENSNALKLLQRSLKRYGCSYKYRAITTKKGSSIQVALLSKIPIQTHRDIVVRRRLGERNILEVKFLVEGRPLYIFVNHWNSKMSPESKRISSAKALRKRVLSLPKGSEYLLIGDFNSNYNEYRQVEKTGINHVLATIKKKKLIRKNELDTDAFEHYNLWLELPIYKRWSHNFYGKKQGLDAILLPHSMLDGKGIDYVDSSFYMFKKNYLFTPKGYIFRWLYRKGRHRGKGYSDHLAVYAKFSTEPFDKKNFTLKQGNIKQLHKKKSSLPLLLKKVKVISVEKNKVYIRDELNEKIAIYGIDQALEEGNYYDMVVFKRKFYKGNYEIIDFRIEKRYDSIKKRN